MQKLRKWKAISNIAKSRRKKYRRRNGLSLCEDYKKFPKVKIVPPHEKQTYFSQKQIPMYQTLCSPNIKTQTPIKKDSSVSLSTQPTMVNSWRRFLTPIKRQNVEQSAFNSSGSPIDELKARTEKIWGSLKNTNNESIRKKLIEEYNKKIQKTESWLQAKFDLVIQSNPQSSKFMSSNLGANNSTKQIKVTKTVVKNGWKLKQSSFVNNILKAKRSASPFLSKFNS